MARRAPQPAGDPDLSGGSPLTMEGRERVRRYLGRGGADRAPLLLFATGFAARLEQVELTALWADVNLLTRTLIGLQSLFGLDAIVLELPLAALRGDQLAAASDAVGRLRTLAGGEAALALALPGPLTRARAGGDGVEATLEDMGDELVEIAQALGPERADCVAVVERTGVSSADVEPLEEALEPMWNAARYYATSSLLVAAEGVAEVADTGADAVAVWAGASPYELARRGARHVGVPIDPASPDSDLVLPQLPEGGFYISRGELPAATEVESLHRLIAAVRQ